MKRTLSTSAPSSASQLTSDAASSRPSSPTSEPPNPKAHLKPELNTSLPQPGSGGLIAPSSSTIPRLVPLCNSSVPRNSTLITAIRANRPDLVTERLNDYDDIDLDQQDEEGRTPIQLAFHLGTCAK